MGAIERDDTDDTTKDTVVRWRASHICRTAKAETFLTYA